MKGLLAAIKSLPVHGPWPQIDEEAWWREILTDARLRLPTAKKIQNQESKFRLDRLSATSLTFSCEKCGKTAALTLADLLRTFGPDRNVRTVGPHVINCTNKRDRREGNDCPIKYRE